MSRNKCHIWLQNQSKEEISILFPCSHVVVCEFCTTVILTSTIFLDKCCALYGVTPLLQNTIKVHVNVKIKLNRGVLRELNVPRITLETSKHMTVPHFIKTGQLLKHKIMKHKNRCVSILNKICNSPECFIPSTFHRLWFPYQSALKLLSESIFFAVHTKLSASNTTMYKYLSKSTTHIKLHFLSILIKKKKWTNP